MLIDRARGVAPAAAAGASRGGACPHGGGRWRRRQQQQRQQQQMHRQQQPAASSLFARCSAASSLFFRSDHAILPPVGIACTLALFVCCRAYISRHTFQDTHFRKHFHFKTHISDQTTQSPSAHFATNPFAAVYFRSHAYSDSFYPVLERLPHGGEGQGHH